MLYWLSNPIWIGGTLSATVIATLNAFVLSSPLGTSGEIIVGLVFTWFTVGTAIIARGLAARMRTNCPPEQ